MKLSDARARFLPGAAKPVEPDPVPEFVVGFDPPVSVEDAARARRKTSGVAAALRKVREGRDPATTGAPGKVFAKKGGRFTADGATDAILHFGRYVGRSLSDLARDREGEGYVRWLARNVDFPEDLRNRARIQLVAAGRPA